MCMYTKYLSHVLPWEALSNCSIRRIPLGQLSPLIRLQLSGRGPVQQMTRITPINEGIWEIRIRAAFPIERPQTLHCQREAKSAACWLRMAHPPLPPPKPSCPDHGDAPIAHLPSTVKYRAHTHVYQAPKSSQSSVTDMAKDFTVFCYGRGLRYIHFHSRPLCRRAMLHRPPVHWPPLHFSFA